MKHLLKKDYNFRKRFVLFEKKRIIYKYLFRKILNLKFSIWKKKLYLKKFYKFFSKNKIYTKSVKWCFFTNWGRVSSSRFGVSRSLLKEMLGFGLIPGYKKSVW